MSQISDPQFTVEDLTTYMNANVARRIENSRTEHLSDVLADGGGMESAASGFVPREAPTLRLQPPFEFTDDANDYHADDLLQYHDKDFLRNAYRAVLKRLPDPEGFNRYLQSLRSGRVSKIDVLASMRYSAEGAAHAVRIKSLRFPAIVRRAGRVPLFGYFVRLVIAILRLPRNVEVQRQSEVHSLAQSERVAEHLNEVSRHVAAEMRRLADHFAGTLEEQHLRHTRATTEQNERLVDLAVRADESTSHLNDLASHVGDLDSHAAEVERRADERENIIRGELGTLNQNLQHARMTLTLLEQRIASLPASVAAARAASPSVVDDDVRIDAPAAPGDGGGDLDNDAFYSAFTERFRGSTEEIGKRLRVHLKLFEDAPDGEIVDLGSGRGEWLELLRESGRAAYGVDTNRLMAEACRARGLRVIDREALAHLRELPDDRVAAICGFHIVEHLPPGDLMRLVQEAMRVLRPGGIVLFETPNPENVLVGSHLFYTDPTHRHPLPSSTLRFLLESCGFDRIELRNLHPRDADKIGGEDADELTRRFNHLFYGPMDYSLSGRKPTHADAAPTS